MTLSRRRFLIAGIGVAAARALPLAGWLRPVAANASSRFSMPLPRPAELTGADLDIRVRPAAIQLLPDGPPTSMWTFNGTFPGPTIRRPSGERTTVTFHHELPAADSLTIHHHGGHHASIHDGQPEREVIVPGASRRYVYDLTHGADPERGAMHWYHDHSHLRTGRNVWRGLLGLFIVEDGVDETLGLPTGEYDVPLVVADRRFTADNQLVDPFTAPTREERLPTETLGGGFPPGDEVVGDVMLVNGAPQPYFEVEARRYRLRILNASNFRVFNFALTDGRPLIQVANESGLLPAPVNRRNVLLGPAERAEVVVDFSDLESGSVDLVSVPLEPESAVPRTAPTIAGLMRFNVGSATPDSTVVPPSLVPLPTWVSTLSHVPDRVWVFSLGADDAGRTAWTINGRAFDHERIDARAEASTTETWLLVNAGPVAISHYVHIHGADWYTLSRNLAPPAPWEAAVKETLRLDPGEVVLVGTRFGDHLGPFMMHCHMLEHEDHGMMTTFEIVEPGSGDAPTGHLGTDDPIAALLQDALPPASAAAARSIVDEVSRTGRAAPPSLLGDPTPIGQPFVCNIPSQASGLGA